MSTTSDRPSPGARPRGIAVLALIVLAGMSVVAVYRWLHPRALRQSAERVAAAPSTTAGRLALWREFGAPQIVEHLRALRVSSTQPFLASFVVVPAGGARDAGELEVWGIDLTDIGPDCVRSESERLFVRLPAPGLVAREQLRGPNAELVPLVELGVDRPDPLVRAWFLIEHRFQPLVDRLEQDIPGVEVWFEIGEAVPRRLTAQS